MVEECFIPTTKELQVLKKYASRLQTAITEPRELSMKLFSAGLISHSTLQKVNAPVTIPLAQSYELINDLYHAVAIEPSNFHKLLTTLEDYPPLLTAVSKEMKKAFKTKESKESESANDQQKEIIIADGRSVQRDYDRMRSKLAGLVFNFQKVVEEANISIEDLKQYVILYREECKDEFKKAQDFNEVFFVIRSKFCSLFNYEVLVRIAEYFELADGFKVIKEYEAEEENYRKLLSSSTLASELQRENELLRQNLAHAKNIVLKFKQWPRPPAPTVVEFLEIIKEVFSDLGDLIHLLEVKEGSIIVTMCAPERAIGALIVLAKRKIAYLKDMGVTWLKIGNTMIIEDMDKVYTDQDETLTLKQAIVQDANGPPPIPVKAHERWKSSSAYITAISKDTGDPPPIPVRPGKDANHPLPIPRSYSVGDAPPPIPARPGKDATIPRSSSVGGAPPIPVRVSKGSTSGSTEIVPTSLKETDAPSPATPTSPVQLSECGWYWQNISREEVRAKLKDALEGSFLVRDSEGGAYTLTVKTGEQNKLVRIINSNGMYGFSGLIQYRSVPDLIDHYREVSLSQYNRKLDVKLVHPVSRFAKISDEGVKEEDEENDVEELLENLKNVTELFDSKIEVYFELEKKAEITKKEVDTIYTAVKGYSNMVELLTEQHEILRKQNLDASKMEQKDRMNVMENAKLLSHKITVAESSHKTSLQQLRDCNSKFRALDRDLNVLRPELMRLQWEKDQYTSKLVQEGLSHQEISDRVKDKAINESESIYAAIYGAPKLQDEDEERNDNYEPPLVTQNIYHPGPRPPLPPRSSDSLQKDLREKAIESDSYMVKWQNQKPSSEIQSIQPPPIPPPPKHSISQTTPPTLVPLPHIRPETWYIECDRLCAHRHLRGKQNGTFLCRPSRKAMPSAKGGLHTHTIDIVYNGIKSLKVVQDSNRYGFAIPCCYDSLLDLVLHYSEKSLEIHNPILTTTLAFPVFT
uniref:SH2 domain-containing protein n=1 Tax=Amphimedon queenslandica TaxID=400682 RepID=A0A1X7VM49_AMPQE